MKSGCQSRRDGSAIQEGHQPPKNSESLLHATTLSTEPHSSTPVVPTLEGELNLDTCRNSSFLCKGGELITCNFATFQSSSIGQRRQSVRARPCEENLRSSTPNCLLLGTPIRQRPPSKTRMCGDRVQESTISPLSRRKLFQQEVEIVLAGRCFRFLNKSICIPLEIRRNRSESTVVNGRSKWNVVLSTLDVVSVRRQGLCDTHTSSEGLRDNVLQWRNS